MGQSLFALSSAPAPLSPVRGRTLFFKKGQMFEGTVLKLFPNQTALLRMGSMNVTARLEAALAAGNHYLFQVKQNEGVPRLKVLQAGRATSNQSPGSVQTSSALEAMGLANNKQNKAMLEMLLKEEVPFSKELITKGGHILQRADTFHEQGVHVLSNMYKQQLPLTEEVFQALYQAEKGVPLSQQLQGLKTQLERASESRATSSLQQQSNQAVYQSLMATLEAGVLNNKGMQEAAPVYIQQLLHLSALENISSTLKQGAASLMTKAGVVPDSFGSDAWLASFQAMVIDQRNREIVQNIWPHMSAKEGMPLHTLAPNEFYHTLMTQFSMQEGKAGSKQLQQLLSLFYQAAGKTPDAKLLYNSMLHAVPRWQDMMLSTSEKQAYTVLLQGSFMNTSSDENSMSFVAKQITQLLQQIGMHHERDLRQGVPLSREEAAVSSLKQTLLEYTPYLSSDVKNSAETLLARLTGQQILTQHQEGLVHQSLVQLPLLLGHHRTDLTIQWEGKKQDNGSIDPNHCRILFYLELEHLGETIADVQIQRRYVTVNVLNDHPKPEFLLELLQPFLQEKLSEHHYSLTSVNWKERRKEASFKPAPSSKTAVRQGVDVRV
ncbi:hypothetical protein SAMN05192534_101194 [Alteribacillus persepolensis]|uniref:Hook-length control protein FliK n=1 Tax=Alteribacillus persepolensis TaxID=568899 RepID=A0A1G7YLM2_9BACI|nr:hypothetical protein [Alteribacillus persepolensis]SDG97294.1 hypothetical protein SAMN05192534_101194 [Alteribacillus persepolensis]